MRLLNTTTLTLHDFTSSSRRPPYAILSHTWAPSGEVTLTDLLLGPAHASRLPGYAKLQGCCARARLDGYAFAWIDTCCIDKSSSAELSEAINSMFAWYQAAGVCYALLADVGAHGLTGPFLNAESGPVEVLAEFRASRWFTRGWTLQELIAPERVEFFSREWVQLGTRLSLEALVSEVTGIETRALRGAAVGSFTAATRMRWAAGRETTREEDAAYCLLGVFGVNMPLLYGEGARTFQRLQEEIVKNDGDYSILAWKGRASLGAPTSAVSALAESPEVFGGHLSFPADVGDEFRERLERHAWGHLRHHKIRRQSYYPPIIVSLGLLLTLPARLVEVTRGFKRYLVSTECAIYLDGRVMVICVDLRAYDHPYISELAIMQRGAPNGQNPSCLQVVDAEDLKDMELTTMYFPWPRSRDLRLQHRRLTQPSFSLLQLLLPSSGGTSPGIAVLETSPKLPVVAEPSEPSNGYQQQQDTTFFQLTQPVGIVSISVSAPGQEMTRFSILYDASSLHQPHSCTVLPFHPIDPQENGSGIIVQDLLQLATSQPSPRTDCATRSFPEHGLEIRASIKVVHVPVEGGDDHDGGGEGSAPSLCIRLTIDACQFSVEESESS